MIEHTDDTSLCKEYDCPPISRKVARTVKWKCLWKFDRYYGFFLTKKFPDLIDQKKNAYISIQTVINDENINAKNIVTKTYATQIFPICVNDHREITSLLDRNTYYLPDEKHLRVVLRSISDQIYVNGIREDLHPIGIPIQEEQWLIKKDKDDYRI